MFGSVLLRTRYRHTCNSYHDKWLTRRFLPVCCL